MAQTKSLIDTLKSELKRQGKTYADVATALSLSEASVKRLFSERTFNLNKLDRICECLGMEISDLVRLMEQATQLTTHLTLKQEQELVSDIELLLMAHFLMSRWTFSEIVETYDISELKGIRLLARLDRMKIIQLLPGNRVKLMISKNFEWINNGPIQRFYEEKVQSEFFDSSFNGPGEYRVFLSGMLTRNSNAETIRRLKRVANEFNEMSIDDESFPMDERFGTSVLMAMRPWGAEVFGSLRRGKAKKF
ncbi:MAG: helix-turn-helix transcriptional regulator [Gammaproteobacteria bacterium]|nr:helix-turn-helix transcriptional regulator [Gammaproteobacteria bacterium]